MEPSTKEKLILHPKYSDDVDSSDLTYDELEKIITQPALPTKKEIEAELNELRVKKELNSHKHLVGSKTQKNKAKKMRLNPRDTRTTHKPYWDVKATIQISAMQAISQDSFTYLDALAEYYGKTGKIFHPGFRRKDFVFPEGFCELDSFAFYTHCKMICAKPSGRLEGGFGCEPFDVKTSKLTLINDITTLDYTQLMNREIYTPIGKVPNGFNPRNRSGGYYARMDEFQQIMMAEYESYDDIRNPVVCGAREVIQAFASSVLACGNYRDAFEHFRARFCYITSQDRNHHWSMYANQDSPNENCAITIAAIAFEYMKGVWPGDFHSTKNLGRRLIVQTNRKDITRLLDDVNDAGVARGLFWNKKVSHRDSHDWKYFIKHPLLSPAYRYLKVKHAIFTSLCRYFRISTKGDDDLDLSFLVIFASQFWYVVDKTHIRKPICLPQFECGCKYDYATNLAKSAGKDDLCPHAIRLPKILLDTSDDADDEEQDAPKGYSSIMEAALKNIMSGVKNAPRNVVQHAKNLKSACKDEAGEALDHFLERVKTFIGESFSEVLAPFVNAVTSGFRAISEPFRVILNFLSSMKTGTAEFLQPVLNRFGLHNINIDESVTTQDILIALICYLLFNHFESTLFKGLVVGFAIWYWKIHTLFPAVWAKLRNFLSEPEVAEDTSMDWTIFEKFICDDQISTISRIITFILCAVCGYACTKNSRMHISEMFCAAFRNIHFVGAGLIGVVKIIEVFEKILPKAIRYIRDKMGLENPDDPKTQEMAFKRRALKFIISVSALDSEHGMDSMKNSIVLQKSVVDMMDESLRLQSLMLDTEIYAMMDADFRMQLRHAIKRHIVLYNVCYRVCKYGGFRHTPFHVQIFGKPGQGKTSMILPLTQKIKAAYYPDIPPQNLVWSRSATDHFDGYHNQRVVIMDDIWKINDATQFTETLVLISNAPTIVPMANLEDKATYFDSDWVISTVNLPYPSITDVLCHDAVYRRRHALVQAVCDPVCINPESCKFDMNLFKKAYPNVTDEQFRRELPHMRFNFVKPLPGTKGGYEYVNGVLDEAAYFGDEDTLPAGVEKPLCDLTYTQMVNKLFAMRSAMREEEDRLREDSPEVFYEGIDETLNLVDQLVDQYELAKTWKMYKYIHVEDDDLLPAEDPPVELTPGENDPITQEALSNMSQLVDTLISGDLNYVGAFENSEVQDTNDTRHETFEERKARILAKKGKAGHVYGQTHVKLPFFGENRVDNKVRIEECAMPVNCSFFNLFTWTKWSAYTMPRTNYLTTHFQHLFDSGMQVGDLYIDFLRDCHFDNGQWYYDTSMWHDVFPAVDGSVAANTPLTKYNFMASNSSFMNAYMAFLELPHDMKMYCVDFAKHRFEQLQAWKKCQLHFKKVFLKTTSWFVMKAVSALALFLKALPILIFAFAACLYVVQIILIIKVIKAALSPKEDTSRVYFKAKSNQVFRDTTDQVATNYTHKIAKNIYQCHIGTNRFSGLGMDGHFLLVPFHSVRAHYEAGQDIEINLVPTTRCPDEWSVVIAHRDIHPIKNADACLLYSRHLPASSRIKHLFFTEKDFEQELPTELFLAASLMIGGRPQFVTHRYGNVRLLTNFKFTSHLLGTTVGRRVLSYNGVAPVGTSGGPLYAPSKFCTRGIYGLQSNRDGHSSFGAVVTQEDIDMVLQKYEHVNIIHDGPIHLDTEGASSPTEMLINSHLKVVGTLEPHHICGIVRGTQYVKTVISSEFPSERIPAVIDAFDKRVSPNTHPLAHSVNKFGRDVMTPLNLERLQRATTDVVYYIRSLIGPHKLRTLNIRDAITGLCEDGFKSMNLKTSPGIPWLFGNPQPGKRNWVEFDLEGNVSYLADELVDQVTYFLAELSQGRVPPAQMFEFPKDELRPVAKALGLNGSPMKTRSITVVNFVFGIIFRMYHLDLEAQLHKRANGISQFCVGINPSGMAWTTMFHDLKRTGSMGFDFDVGNWDGHFPPELWFATTDVVNALYDDGEMNARIRHGIADHTIFGYDQFLDLVFQKLRGMPSGHPGTAFTNTLGHLLLFRYFYLEICEDLGLTTFSSFDSQLRNVSVRFYGDDVICSLSDNITMLGVDASKFVDCYLKYGWPVTAAEKTADPRIMKPVEELTFLKRSFIPDEVMGTAFYHGGIEKSVIMDLLHWVKNSLEVRLQTHMNIFNAFEFAVPYGPIYYEDLRRRVNLALLNCGEDTFGWSYHDMRELVLSRVYE